jgi:hypothetical protein
LRERIGFRIIVFAGLCLALLGARPIQAAPAFASPAGAPPVRVVSVQNPDATEAFRVRADIARAMVDRGIIAITGKSNVAAAWRSILWTNGPASSNEVVGIKVFSTPGPNSGTRAAVVAGVVEGLLAAGLTPKQIIIWDKQATDLRLAGFFRLADRYGVRVAGSAQAGYDEKIYYDSPLLGNLVWGDMEFGRTGGILGGKSFFSKLITQDITKIINVTPLLNNNLAGVTGNLYGLAAGSVDNFFRFESDPSRLASAVPEIYALPSLSDRVVLNIVDGLICQYEGEERSLLHYSTMLNELRFSSDPVALDTLSLKTLDRERGGAPAFKSNIELYNNAVLLELGVNDLKRIQVETVH